MATLIRRATFADIIAIRRIATITWTQTYQHIIPQDIQAIFLQRNYSDHAMRNRLERSLLLVAETDGEINGFANFFSSKVDVEEAELGAIYILPEWQSKGIGTQLLHKGIEELSGVKRLFVDVEKDNLKGYTFYSSKGFVVIKEYEEQFHGHKLKLLKMVLGLS